MFDWFKRFFTKTKPGEVVNSAGFRVSVMPKVADYPRSQYSAHWEIIKMQYQTFVRIYDNKGKLITYSTFEDDQKVPMDERIAAWLKTKMEAYKV